jgi:hypothetical protein
LTDDSRWGGPLPLRFELLVTTLFIGALDAFEVASNILQNRASQQAFGCLRFQMETLALARWLIEPDDPRDRQMRAYRVLYGQISRWRKLLREDVGDDPEGKGIVEQVEGWDEHLRKLAKEDGLQHLKTEPGRRHLLAEYSPETGYPTFSMYSELGSHPGAIGNILFSLNIDSRTVDYTLDGAIVARAFCSGIATMHLWWICQTLAPIFGWDEWLASEAALVNREALPLIEDAARRKREERLST